ncbi:MAG: DUF2341 domain-containing protein, partial [Euryarchaeota archaeon]|nr:DUF2341 domain-containing protein [Euryarchaeota archaeon]
MKIKFTYRKWFVLIIAFLFVGTNVLSFTGHSGMQKESMDTALSFEIPIDRVSQPEIQKSLLDSEPWWNTNWTYRKNITIDHIKVSGDLQNFPVLMNNISSDFTQHAQPDGDDFVFVDSTNTVLYNHEIESYDSVTGELLVWVNIASLSSTVDTVIWMYYGNPTCTNQQNPIGTWDSDYQMVQHLKDTTSSTTIDSTSNNNNGTKKAVNEPTESIGKIGKAQDLDGTDDIITVNDNAGLSTLGPISVEAWIKTSDGISDQGIISKDAGSSGTREWLLMTSYSPPNPAIGFYLHSFTPSNYLNVWTKVINFADNTWHHVVATWDGTNAAGHIQIYIDGISRTLYNDAKIGTGCTPFDGTAPVEIGRSYAFDSTCFDGNIDESRVSKVLRSAIWISTEYNNQNSPLTFSSISNEQHRPLVADFTFSPEIPLTMELVYFISTSYVLGGYITDWAWDFGDGNTSFIEYPTHIYTSCGVYAVSLCVKDNDNGEDTITKSITINSPPIADFTISSTNPFTSEVISFSDTSTDLCGSIVARFWDFGDGTFCPEQFSLQTIKHYYLTSGNYTASLRVTDNNGTMNSTTKTICVSLGFSSDIYVDDDYVDYLPEWGTTHFNTIHNGIDVAIETGSIYVFNGFYPEHLMVDKSIRLTGENNEATIVDGSNTGNVFTITENDIILSGFKVQYGGNAGVSLQSTSNVIISGNSIVNNGNGIDVHTTSNMNYISENTINENNRGVFIYDDSNENTISKNIIFGNTQDGIRIEHLCVENQIFENTISQCANGIYLYDACNNNKIYHNNLMDNTKNARDYCTINYWDDGYPSGGNYWSDYYGVDVSPKDGIGDSPYSVFGGPNKDHYPYMYSTGWINKHPMAGFTYSPENPTTDNFVTFTDTSEDLDGIVVSWLWEFGDGNISTLQNPTHQYADDGNYLISLTVTDNYGAINTTYRSIIVSTITNHAPYKPSNPIPADGAINVDFTEAIISWYGGDPDLGDYVRYHIYFGIDPENLDYYGATPFFPSNNSDPFTHNFGFSLNSGTIYYWGIIAEDDEYVPTNGPLWSYTTAGQSISADFTFTPENPMNTSLIHFTDTSTDYDGIIISWWWNFDDHYYSDLQNPVHCYYEDGIYNVTLTVTDDDGATSSITKMIVVGETNQPPAANFTYAPSQPTTADTIQFTDTSVDSDGNIVFWLWNFGDSNTSNTQNPTHRYQIPGTYPVTLTVTDNDGATNTTTKPITINEGFIAKWNFDEGTGSTAHDTSGYNNHGTIYGGDWVPGISGTALEITNTDIVRNIPGAFDDPITTSFTISGWVHWYGPTGLPTEDSSIFDARKGSGGGFVIYLKASGAVEFFLIKSDNSLQVIRSNTVLPANAGWAHITGVFDQTTQTLRLYINGVEDSASPVVASAPYSQTTLTASIGNNRWAPGDHQWSPLNGKLDELCIYNRALSPLEIHYLYEQYASNQPPIANFNYTPQNPTTLDIISFTDISNDPDGTIVSWDWDFGNGNPSALQNPTHQYSIAETYSVTLTVSDDDGATDSITKQITITDDLIACWHFDEGEGSIAHDTSTFGNDGTIYGTDWVPGVSGSALDITDTDIIRFIPDTFDDPINTAFTISGWVYWYGPHGYPTDCSIFDGRTNANAGFALYIHIDGTVGFFLRKPDGSVQDIRSTTVLPINNKWTYIAGVFDQTTQTLRLYINGIEDAASPVYAPYPYYHSTLTATIGNNRWAPGDHQWSPLNGKLDEIYIYKRSLSSQEIHNVYEHYAPNQPPIADFTYTPENPTTNHVILFSDTSSDSDGTIVNWTWDFGDGTVSYDQNPTYQYLDHIAYTVVLMVTDDDGETDSISKSVIVHNAEPLASFTYIPENPSNIDFIQFIDTSTDPDGTIVSWLWDFGDDNISTEQNPTYRYTTAGTYIVTLSATDDDGATDSIGKNIIVIETGPSVNWIEMQKLFAPSGVARDNFGWSVSLDDDTALIGVPGDDTSKGSTYVFIRTGDTWTQQQKLLASDGQANDHFGESVSLDGDTALIGAYGDDNEKGSAYVFTRIGTTWTQQAKLIASDGAAGDEFGFYVSLDNDTALIGAVADDDIGSISGSAYIFTRAGTTWTQQQKLHAADGESQDRFGFSVSLEDDTALIGAIYGDGIKVDSGSEYVFIRTGITWTQQQKLFASDGA